MSDTGGKQFDFFAFHVHRFLTGTMKMTDLEAGRYIRLLCIQWLNGYVEPEMHEWKDEIEVRGSIVSMRPYDNKFRPEGLDLSGLIEIIENHYKSGSPQNDAPSNAPSIPDGKLDKSGSPQNHAPSNAVLLSSIQNYFSKTPGIFKIRLDKDHLWGTLSSKFREIEDGKYQNERLEKERTKVVQKIDTKSSTQDKARKAALARWGKVKGSDAPSNAPSINSDIAGSSQNHAPSNAPSISGSSQNHAPSNASSMENKNKILYSKEEGDAPSIQASGTEEGTNHSLKTNGVKKENCAAPNFMIHEHTLKNGTGNPIRLSYYLDESETAKQLQLMVTKSNMEVVLMAFAGRSDDFKKFALEKFILESLIEAEGLHSGMYLKKLTSAIQMRMTSWEKEFNRLKKDLNWFHKELEKYKDQYSADHIATFKDYYLTLLPSNSYQFQMVQNFKMELSLKGWSGIPQRKVNGKNGHGSKHVAGVTISEVAKMSPEDQMKYYTGK